MTTGNKKNRRISLVTLMLLSVIMKLGISHAFANTLLYAVKTRDFDGVQAAIANGADINAAIRGETALIAASYQGNVKIVNILLQKGADVNVKTGADRTALMYAVENDSIDIIKLLVQEKANVNSQDYSGMTPLMMATSTNKIEIVDILLKHGADVNLTDKRNNTALSWALRNNAAQAARLLLSSGATIHSAEAAEIAINTAKKRQWDSAKLLIEQNIISSNAKTKREKTLLMIAAEQGELEPIEFLIDHHADISETTLFSALRRKHCDIARFLLNQPFELTSKNTEERTALMEASASGCIEVVKELIARGADINRITTAKRYKGSTALFLAIDGGHIDIVKLLLEHKADTEIEDQRSSRNKTGTALTLAILWKQFDIVELLLKHGANVKAAVRSSSALQLAVERGEIDIIPILLKYGADVNEQVRNNSMFHWALKSGKPEIAKLLIENGAIISAKGENGAKLLIDVLENGYFDIANILILQGADVNARQYRYKPKQTALIIASESTHNPKAYKTVQLLTERGAEINATDKDGNTALHYARDSQIVNYLLTHNAKASEEHFISKIEYLDIDTIKLFLEKHNYIHTADKYGNTPLIKVTRRSNRRKAADIVKLLLQHGADPNRKNNSGETAIMVAARGSKPELVKLLWENGADLTIKDNRGQTVKQYGSDQHVERLLDWIETKKKNPSESLFIGIKYFDRELVKKAVRNGANTNVREQRRRSRFWGFTSFQLAVYYGYTDIVKFLTEQGSADLNSYSPEGNALVIAARQGHQDIVKYLIEKGADVQPQFGTSPISVAEERENNEMIALLQTAGAQSSRTLWKAVIKNDYKTVKDELEKGVNANDPILLDDYKGWSPLAVAAKLNFADIAGILIQHKADVNARTTEPPFYKWGGTILHTAVAEGNENIVKLLSENGANVEAKFVTGQFKGFTPLKIAEEENNLNLIRILKESGAKTSDQKEEMKKALFQAVLSGNLDKVKSLIDDGVDVNTQIDKNNKDVLKTVIWENEEQYSENLTWLLKNYKLSRTTALVVAISQGYGEITRLLLDKGAGVNIRIIANNSKYSITPLLLATYLGNAEIVQMLIEHGADIHVRVATRDLGGKTALSIAVKKNNLEIVQLLLRAGIIKKSAGIQKSEAPAEELQSVDQMLEHGEKIIPELIKILRTRASSPSSTESLKEWRHTVAVMDMLAEWKAEQAVGVLREMITSSDDLSAIYNAARTVGKIGGNISFTALTNILAESDNSQDENAIHRKRAAILGLGLCGNTQAVPLLLQEMQDKKNDDLIQVCAAGSLGLLGNQSGLQVALEGTDSTDPELRLRSIEMIGAIGAPSALKKLEDIINSQAPYVYKVAVKTSMMMIEAQQLSGQEQIKYLAENLVKFHRMTAFVWWGTSRLKALNTEESRKSLQSLTEAGSSFVRDTARLKLQTMQ